MEGVWVPEAAEALLSSRSLLSSIPWLTICIPEYSAWTDVKKMDERDQCQLPRSHYPSQTKISPRDDYLESGVGIITQIPD